MDTYSQKNKSIAFDFYRIDERHGIELPFVTIPVNAGFPSPAEQYIEEKIDLVKLLIKKPSSTYVLKVKGQSMRNVGIFDNSIIVVDTSIKPANNLIAVCLIDGEFTLKRISKIGSTVYLLPENSDFKPIEVKEGSNLEIWGIVMWVLNQPK